MRRRSSLFKESITLGKGTRQAGPKASVSRGDLNTGFFCRSSLETPKTPPRCLPRKFCDGLRFRFAFTRHISISPNEIKGLAYVPDFEPVGPKVGAKRCRLWHEQHGVESLSYVWNGVLVDVRIR